ncbi:MAG: PIG-L family deacetylase [Kiritimatiellae bacterium]|nr:PIG-L family deacetylase [Kiritimatiellia bacterium]
MTNIDLSTLVPTDRHQAISDLSLSDGLRILVLAPHPDDFDAICVTLKFLSDKGHCVHVAVSRTGSGIEDAYCPGLTQSQKADLREEEQRRSSDFFGLPKDCLKFLALANDAEDQPLDNSENRAAILALLQKETPDIVFLPHANDTNSGHRAIYSLLTQAARSSGRSLVALLNRDPKTIAMRTDLYMPFDQGKAEWKAQMLRFHDSQHQRNLRTRGHGFDDRILDLNRTIARDLSLKCEYAEAFEVELHRPLNMGKETTSPADRAYVAPATNASSAHPQHWLPT